MVVCLTSARFVMKADVLRAEPTSTYTPTDPEDPEAGGQWVTTQDPDSGELIRKWQKNATNKGTPQTSDDVAADALETFPCEARGIIDGGIRVAGTTERFSDMYEGVDYVRISFPANVKLTRRDRITNIRDAKGNILWIEEERHDLAPTIFNVVGVTPVIAPFVGHVENVALLERVEGQ